MSTEDAYFEALENLGELSLEHYGVKGMKWGVRREDAGGRVSRKQNKALNKAAQDEFRAKKADALYKEAKKGGESVLVEMRLPNDYAQTVVTGKQFADHLEAGGVFDIRMTEIFARQPKPNSQYVLNENKIGDYQKKDFRK